MKGDKRLTIVIKLGMNEFKQVNAQLMAASE